MKPPAHRLLLLLLVCVDGVLCLPSRMASAASCDFAAAIEKDDLKAIVGLLERGCDPNVVDPKQGPPLYQAAMNDHPKAVRLLLARGAAPTGGDLPFHLAPSTDTTTMRLLLDHGLSVDHRNAEGDTLLHAAASSKYSEDPDCESARCWHGYSTMVRLLLSRGANPNLRNRYGDAPIHVALESDLDEVAWILLHARRSDLLLPNHRGSQPLHLAAIKGSTRIVTYLLSRGVDPSAADAGGDTPLHYLSEGGTTSGRPRAAFLTVARLLVTKGAKLGIKNKRGETPLHKAAEFGNDACEADSDLGRLLVGAGAPVDSRDGDGRTPLHDAALAGNANLVELLLRKGAEPQARDKAGLTPLHWMAAHARPCIPLRESWRRTVALLVKAGARLQDIDAVGRTPLWFAISGGRSKLVELMLAPSAAAEPGPRRATPVHLAAYLDDAWAVRALLDAGAPRDARDDRGASPLHWAAVHGSARAAALLLENGAAASPLDNSGRTPLDLASMACEENTSELLRRAGASRAQQLSAAPCSKASVRSGDARLDKAYLPQDLSAQVRAGISVDARDSQGRTPLHLIAAHFFLKTELRSLLDRHADPNARDDRGMTALHVAATDARLEIAQILVTAGADPNAIDLRGRTPLHLIPFRNDVHDLAAMLIEKGADPAIRDRLGRTALHSMADTRDVDVARAALLVCHGASPETRDLMGWTASDLAAIRGWPDPSPVRCGCAGPTQ